MWLLDYNFNIKRMFELCDTHVYMYVMFLNQIYRTKQTIHASFRRLAKFTWRWLKILFFLLIVVFMIVFNRERIFYYMKYIVV